MKLKTKQLFYVLCGTSVVLLSVLGGGYYFETNRIKAETLQLSRKMADATAAGEELDQLSQLKQQFQALQPALAKLNVALPSQKNQSVVVLQIQQLAANAGMQLPSASFQASNGLPTATSQTIKSGAVLALPISFQLTGTYAQLQKFLQQAEQLGRYNDVSSLSITRGSGSNLVFSIALNVYVKL